MKKNIIKNQKGLLISRLFPSSNNSKEDLSDNYSQNYTNTYNFQIPYKMYHTKDNILKSKSEINTTSSYKYQTNYKYNNYNDIQKKIKY